MKKLVVLFAAFVVSFQTFAYDPINEKLIRSFKSSFPNAAQVNWQEIQNAFIVSFVDQNIRARAYYDKEGALTQVIRYYHEQTLPFNILHTIKQQFGGKKIFGIVEVTAPSADKTLQTEYFVKLEDARHWITVKVYSDGNTTVTQRLRKA
jgi:hypothetical protein